MSTRFGASLTAGQIPLPGMEEYAGVEPAQILSDKRLRALRALRFPDAVGMAQICDQITAVFRLPGEGVGKMAASDATRLFGGRFVNKVRRAIATAAGLPPGLRPPSHLAPDREAVRRGREAAALQMCRQFEEAQRRIRNLYADADGVSAPGGDGCVDLPEASPLERLLTLEREAFVALAAALLNRRSCQREAASVRVCKFDELVDTARAAGLFAEIFDDADDQNGLLKPGVRSRFGRLLGHYIGQTMTLPDGRVIEFGSRGRCRHRRYTFSAGVSLGNALPLPPAGQPLFDEANLKQEMGRMLSGLASTAPVWTGDVAAARKYEFAELVAAARATGAFKTVIGSDLRQMPTPTAKSVLGKLWTRCGGQTFLVDDGLCVRLDVRGKQRHRRYLLSLLPVRPPAAASCFAGGSPP